MNEPWFRPKKFGYGVTPIHWKGWVSSLILIFAVLAVVRFLIVPMPGAPPHSLYEQLLGGAIIVALIVGFNRFAATKTNGDWRWRWGARE